MAVEREGVIRLTLEKGGEADAFEKPVKDLRTLREEVAAAEGDLGKLASALDGLDLEELGASAEEVANLRKEWSEFEQLVAAGRTGEAVKQLERALEQLAGPLQRAGAEGKEAFAALEASLRSLERAGAKALDPVEAALDSARAAATAFGDAVAKGGDEAVKAGGRATSEMKRLEEAIEAAVAEGRNIDSISVQFRDLANEIDRSTDQLARARVEQKAFEADLRRTEQAAGGQAQAFGGLDDLVGQLGQSLGTGAGKWASYGLASVAAFDAGFSAGNRFRGVLDSVGKELFDVENAADKVVGKFLELVGIDMEEFGDQFTTLTDKIVGNERAAVDLNQQLENQRKIFSELGIDLSKFTQSLEQNDALIQQVARSQAAGAQSAEAFAEELGLSRRALDEQAKGLTDGVETLRKFQGQLTDEQVKSRVESQVQGLLASYAELGVEPPKDLQKLVDALGILPKAMREAVDGTIREAKRLTVVEGEFDNVTVSAEEQAEQLIAAFRQTREAGQDLQKLASQFRDVAALLIESGTPVPETFYDMAAGLNVYIDRAKVAGAETAQLNTALGKAADGTEQMTAAQFELNEALRALNLQRLYDGLEPISDASLDAAEGLGAVADRARAAAGPVDQYAQGFRDVVDAAESYAKASRKVQDSAGDVNDIFAKSTDTLFETEEGWSGVTDSLADTSDKADAAGTSVKQATAEVDALATAGERAQATLEALPEILQQIAAVDLSRAVAGLRQIPELAQQAAAALSALLAQAQATAAAIAAIGEDGTPTDEETVVPS